MSGKIKRVDESKIATAARVNATQSSTRERAINASQRDNESILSDNFEVNQKPKTKWRGAKFRSPSGRE